MHYLTGHLIWRILSSDLLLHVLEPSRVIRLLEHAFGTALRMGTLDFRLRSCIWNGCCLQGKLYSVLSSYSYIVREWIV